MPRSRSALVALTFASACALSCSAESSPEEGEEIGETSEALSNVCPSTSVKGIDIASFQHPGGASIDWHKVANDVKFAVIKSTQGNNYHNPYYSSDIQKARNAGLIAGSYHFLAPSSQTGVSGKKQAEYFLAHSSIKAGDLPPMLDVEPTSYYNNVVPSAADVAGWLDKVEAVTGKKPLVYIGYYTIGSIGTPSKLSHYPIDVPNYSSCPSFPNSYPKDDLVMWQYTSTAHISGISGNVDVDKFYGNLAALKAFVGSDADGDGIEDDKDNCPQVKNPGQLDTDGDGKGDKCDGDDDDDGVKDADDNCPKVKNPGQLDTDGDGKGNACQADDDSDGFPDTEDDCPKLADPDQEDADGDGKGDACDDDRDGDGVANADDLCPDDPDPSCGIDTPQGSGGGSGEGGSGGGTPGGTTRADAPPGSDEIPSDTPPGDEPGVSEGGGCAVSALDLSSGGTWGLATCAALFFAARRRRRAA